MSSRRTPSRFDLARAANLEFGSEPEMRAVQLAALRRHLGYLARHSRFYQARLAAAGIVPARVRAVEDLVALPFTTKADLEAHAADFLCVPPDEVVDLCLTSGTTGQPVAFLQTRSDLDRLGYNEAVSFRAAGLAAGDRVLISAAIDRCFMAGLAYFLGLNRLGATAIRAGSGNLPLLMEMVRRCRPTAIVGVPTLILAVGERLAREGDDVPALGVRRIIGIGEPLRDTDLSLSALGRRLTTVWGAGVFGTYASTEMATAFADCTAGQGGHVHPDLVVVEIVDEAGRPLPPGQPGEVVATPLGVTGMPLLRFRTGDLAALHPEPCACGRRSPRLGPVLGRKCQMLKVRGTTVYPPAIFAVLQSLREVQGYYMEVFDEYELSDRVRVVVGVDPSAALDAAAVADRIGASIRVRPEVVVATPEEVQRKTNQADKRKPVIFFDYRRSRHAS